MSHDIRPNAPPKGTERQSCQEHVEAQSFKDCKAQLLNELLKRRLGDSQRQSTMLVNYLHLSVKFWADEEETTAAKSYLILITASAVSFICE